MDDCIFCQIVAGKLPTEKILETDEVLVIKDIKPAAPVHVLIIPKKHIINLGVVEDTDRDLMGKLLLAGRDAAKKLGVADAFKLLVRSGESAGQVVMHLHIHLTGGWSEKQTE